MSAVIERRSSVVTAFMVFSPSGDLLRCDERAARGGDAVAHGGVRELLDEFDDLRVPLEEQERLLDVVDLGRLNGAQAGGVAERAGLRPHRLAHVNDDGLAFGGCLLHLTPALLLLAAPLGRE